MMPEEWNMSNEWHVHHSYAVWIYANIVVVGPRSATASGHAVYSKTDLGHYAEWWSKSIRQKDISLDGIVWTEETVKEDRHVRMCAHVGLGKFTNAIT